MFKKRMFILFCIVVFLFSSIQFASAQFNIETLGGVRPIGMGGAFTAAANDENALYYNPAALACITQKYGSLLLNATVRSDEKSLGVYDFLSKNHTAFRSLLDGKSSNDPAFAADLKKNMDRQASILVSNKLIEAIKPNFGFSLAVIQNIGNKIARGNSKTNLSFDFGTTAIAMFGYGRTISHYRDRYLHFGMSAHYMVDKRFQRPYLIETGNKFTQFLEKPAPKKIYQDTRLYQSLGVDVGFLYEIRNLGLRSGLVVRDFVNFNDQASHTKAYYWGFAFIPSDFLDLQIIKSLILSIDYDNFNDSNWSMSDKLQIGGEIGIPLLSLRAGRAYNSWVYGLRLNLAILRFDIAYSPSYRLPFGDVQRKQMYFVETRIGW